MQNKDDDVEVDKNEKWSHDWNNFDWENVKQKIKEVKKALKQGSEMRDIQEYDIGITIEQFEEFLQWYREYMPEEYNKFLICMFLKEKGFNKQDITFCLSHPKELRHALNMVMKQDKIE